MATEQERNRGLGAYSTPGVDPPVDKRVSQIITSSPIVSFGFDHIAPPSPLYFTTDDLIQLAVVNSQAGVTLNFQYRQLLPDGTIHRGVTTFTPTSDRVLNNFFFRIGEGFLLSFTVGPIGVQQKGQCYVVAGIAYGSPGNSTTTSVITDGYVSRVNVLVWPGNGNSTDAVDGVGAVKSILGTTPAAGAEVNEVVPTGARWRLESILLVLTTSATVANRRPSIQLDDGVNKFFQITWNQQQAASLAVGYVAAMGVTLVPDPVSADFVTTMCDNYLRPAFRITTNTASLQAGDQWSQPKYLVQEWVDV